MCKRMWAVIVLLSLLGTNSWATQDKISRSDTSYVDDNQTLLLKNGAAAGMAVGATLTGASGSALTMQSGSTTTVAGTLTVTGTTTLNSSTTMGNGKTLTINPGSTAGIAGTLSATGASYFLGNVTVANGKAVTLNTGSVLTANDSTKLQGGLRVSGASDEKVKLKSTSATGHAWVQVESQNGTVRSDFGASRNSADGNLPADVGFWRVVTNHPAVIMTNNLERVRIPADGGLLVGVAAKAVVEGLNVTYPSTNQILVSLHNTSTSANCYGISLNFDESAPDNNTSYFLTANDSLATRIQIFSDGDIVNHDNSYGAISDSLDKQDIVPSASLWTRFQKLRLVNARMKRDVAVQGDSAKPSLCLLAQNVENWFPSLVDSNRAAIRVTVQDTDTVRVQVRMLKEQAIAEGYQVSPTDSAMVTVTKDTVTVTQRKDFKNIGPYRRWVNYAGVSLRAVKVLQEAQAKIDTLELDVMGLRAWNLTLQDSLNAQRAEIDAIKARLDALEAP